MLITLCNKTGYACSCFEIFQAHTTIFKNEFSNSFNFFLISRRPGEARSFHAVLPPKLWIHLAVVACGSRLEETLVMLKSAVLFSHRKMQFHIFTEERILLHYIDLEIIH